MGTLKEKIAEAMRADFIGAVVFDEDEIDIMKKECFIFYRKAMISTFFFNIVPLIFSLSPHAIPRKSLFDDISAQTR